MKATNAHFLKIYQDWLPIEAILNDLVPYVQSAKEKIDCLSGQLDAQTVKNLHYLRMQRNRTSHKGHAIVNEARWTSAASDVRAKLEVLQAQRHAAARTQAMQASARLKQGVNTDQTEHVASSVNEPSVGQFLSRMFLKLAIWCAGSWYLHAGVMYVLTSVNTYSAAWWVLHAIGVLCWPGIAVTYLLYAASVAAWWMGETIFAGCVWLLKYIIANPF